MDEEWRTVVGFSDYEISESGVVRNKVTGHVLKGFVNSNGKIKYSLRREMRYFTMYADNMVADAFLIKGEKIRTNRVIHIDGDRDNNHWTNLGYIRGPGRRRTR